MITPKRGGLGELPVTQSRTAQAAHPAANAEHDHLVGRSCGQVSPIRFSRDNG